MQAAQTSRACSSFLRNNQITDAMQSNALKVCRRFPTRVDAKGAQSSWRMGHPESSAATVGAHSCSHTLCCKTLIYMPCFVNLWCIVNPDNSGHVAGCACLLACMYGARVHIVVAVTPFAGTSL